MAWYKVRVGRPTVEIFLAELPPVYAQLINYAFEISEDERIRINLREQCIKILMEGDNEALAKLIQ